jgi:hypothetical protein
MLSKKAPFLTLDETLPAAIRIAATASGGPASAMVARETSNLEAAGSSPALGSLDDHPKSCSFFTFSFGFLGFRSVRRH